MLLLLFVVVGGAAAVAAGVAVVVASGGVVAVLAAVVVTSRCLDCSCRSRRCRCCRWLSSKSPLWLSCCRKCRCYNCY